MSEGLDKLREIIAGDLAGDLFERAGASGGEWTSLGAAFIDEPEDDCKYRRDFLGVKFGPHMYSLYPACSSCGKYVWHSSRIIGLCPHCVIALPEFSLEISFGHSKSEKYRTSLKRARAIPTYVKEGERHAIRFGSLGEYSDCRHAVGKLMSIIWNWKSTSISLNGQPLTADALNSLSWEIDRIRDLAGAAAVTFSGSTPIFTPKKVDPPGMVYSVDYTHPANLIEAEAVNNS